MTSLLPTPFKVQATYSWGGEDKSRDLGFIEGDIIEVIRVASDRSSYYGKSLRTKLFGNFAAKHVKILHIKESASQRSLNGIRQSPSVNSLRFSRKNSSSPSLPSTKSQYGSTTSRSNSMQSLNRIKKSPIKGYSGLGPSGPSGASVPSPKSSPSYSAENSDLFSLKHQSYSYSDFEDQKLDDIAKTDEELLRQLPPVSPRSRYDSKRFSESQNSLNSPNRSMHSSYVQQLLDLSTSSSDTHNSSAFGYSDLSATSAGSYMRHRESRRQQQQRSQQNMSEADRQLLFSRMFNDQDGAKHPNFFKKLLNGDKPQRPSLDEQIFQTSQEKLASLSLKDSQSSFGGGPGGSSDVPDESCSQDDIELERVKSLTGNDRAHRKSRALGEDPELILQPHRFISSLNKNEVASNMKRNYGLDSTPLAHVDRYIDQIPPDRYNSLEEIVRKRIDEQFNTNLEKLRAVYTFLTTRFELTEPSGERLSTKIMPDGDNLPDILYSGICTPHQLTWLFFLMSRALRMESEIVLGYFKRPFLYEEEDFGDDKGLLTLNHSWVSVLIDGEYRLVDVSLGNPTNSIITADLAISDSNTLEDHFNFYFLAKPLDLVYTHVPLHVDNQHIVPPLDPLAQLALPPLYPSFVNYGLRLYKFNKAVFRLQDFEVIDFDLEIPPDFEVKAMVQPLDTANCKSEKSFIQTHWKSGRRLSKIKTILPADCSIAFICCYGRPTSCDQEDTDSHTPSSDYDYSLLLSVPCFHRGKYSPIEWCHTNPLLPPDTSADVYIKEPQIYDLALASSYQFTLKVAPNEPDKDLDTFRCMLISPSGSFSELERIDSETWEVRKTLRETGEWRLVVPNESNGKWHVHAKWQCQ
ncbi:DEKNAAC101858 [Brettanomyces naardenensis]|uniref:DEKNAAC101858 n=1 Tax=Brettanomyces naardenensis TaxID=13370 RepID=A0A448YJ27_BRENA|nr:DEKNAAC101858 [Brettanomyces naardenensis]